MILVGLTGGIGSGKSTVGKILIEMGIPVLDADNLAREVVEPGQPAHADIVAAWPQVVAQDGSIDRQKLAHVVFADPDARARLEAITHPRIRERSGQAAKALEQAGHRLAFYEASLLVEAGRHKEFVDGLVVVTVPEKLQIQRAIARGNQSEEQVIARLAAQMPLSEKIKFATDVIDNSGTLEATRGQVKALAAKLRLQHGLPSE